MWSYPLKWERNVIIYEILLEYVEVASLHAKLSIPTQIK